VGTNIGTVLEALADPTRRAVWERLAIGPMTVGELAADLPVSRPAVSQHLKVLSTAGLVAATPQGTRRIYAARQEGLRVLREYLDNMWRDALESYAAAIDRQPENGGQSRMSAQNPGQTVIAPVRHQIIVNTPAERAFSIFTDGFGTWWPKAHTISPVPVEQAVIEPRAGGRCYDRAVDGSECDWGQVLVWEPPARLVLAWQIDGTWSYEPDVEHASRVTVTFAPDGDRTEVTLVHDEFERHRHAGPELAAGVREGWATSLQAFAAATDTAATDTGPTGTAPAQAGPPAFKYVLTYHSVPDYAPLARLHFPAHHARLVEFHARGDLIMIGLLQEPVNGDSMAVFTSQAAAEEFVADDPFVINKVVATWTIRPWQEVLHQPG
jgi:DNA-binding transcriptional ArsR family regulator/uncharacterized protein YciI/uncharacterized protein YndB with AHSA1/START domain